MPGIGEITAVIMLAEMPELGTMDKRQVASLAGLAPVTRQSGTWKGKSFIRGGRANLRRALYMPTLMAIRTNKEFKHKYDTLRNAAKPAKVAITAVMRKLIILANALIRDQRKWTENGPKIRLDQHGYSSRRHTENLIVVAHGRAQRWTNERPRVQAARRLSATKTHHFRGMMRFHRAFQSSCLM